MATTNVGGDGKNSGLDCTLWTPRWPPAQHSSAIPFFPWSWECDVTEMTK